MKCELEFLKKASVFLSEDACFKPVYDDIQYALALGPFADTVSVVIAVLEALLQKKSKLSNEFIEANLLIVRQGRNQQQALNLQHKLFLRDLYCKGRECLRESYPRYMEELGAFDPKISVLFNKTRKFNNEICDDAGLEDDCLALLKEIVPS